jgi:hypothetical protein
MLLVIIGAAVGKAELSEQLTECYRKKEAMVKQTADAFRNRITIIGTISRRIVRLAKDPALARDAERLYQEIKSLEPHLERFEKDIEIWDLEAEGVVDSPSFWKLEHVLFVEVHPSPDRQGQIEYYLLPVLVILQSNSSKLRF